MRLVHVSALAAGVWLGLLGTVEAEGGGAAASALPAPGERSAAGSAPGVLVAQSRTRTGGGATAGVEVVEAVERATAAAHRRAAASEARAMRTSGGVVGGGGTGVVSEALNAYAEATGAAIDALGAVQEAQQEQKAEAEEARWLEAEAQEEGPRHSAASLEALRKQKPVVDKPPAGVGVEDELWLDYVRYFERRVEELGGEVARPECLKAELEPPLTWRSYQPLRDRFEAARKFQRQVTETLESEARLRPEERVWLRSVPQPLVTENMGLWHEGPCVLTFADQLVVDKASLKEGGTPRVLTFSDKQRDFSKMSDGEVLSQVAMDAEEALKKYSGVVEIRRRYHPLFGQRVTVSDVYLVYDESKLQVEQRGVVRGAASRKGVEVRFHDGR